MSEPYAKNCATCAHHKDGACELDRQPPGHEDCPKYQFNLFTARPPKKRTVREYSAEDFSID